MSYVEEVDLTEFQTPEDLDSKQSPAEGTYLCCVTGYDPSPRNVENAMRFEFEVLSGTVAGQSGKSFSELFNAPTAKAKDGGKFFAKRKAKLMIATGLVTLQNLGKTKSVEWDDIVGKLCVVSVKAKKDSKYVEIDGLEIYSPTDPKVEAVPKDAEAMDMLARSTGTTTAPSANGNGQAAATTHAPATTGKPAGDDFSDV